MTRVIVCGSIVPAERPTEVHDRPCGPCPSAHYPPDPESLDILEQVRTGQV